MQAVDNLGAVPVCSDPREPDITEAREPRAGHAAQAMWVEQPRHDVRRGDEERHGEEQRRRVERGGVLDGREDGHGWVGWWWVGGRPAGDSPGGSCAAGLYGVGGLGAKGRPRSGLGLRSLVGHKGHPAWEFDCYDRLERPTISTTTRRYMRSCGEPAAKVCTSVAG